MPLSGGVTPRWQRNVLYAMVFVILCGVVYVAWSGVGTNNAVTATQHSVERTDCARQINAEATAVRDAAFIADRAARRYLDAVLLDQVVTGPPTPEEQATRLPEYSALVKAAEIADERVSALPDPSVEVDRLCPG